jgi:hypothetical protein
MNLEIMAYLWYLLIICVPTLLFSLGLAFLLMSIIRNQAVTFLILLGIAALNMFLAVVQGRVYFRLYGVRPALI